MFRAPPPPPPATAGAGPAPAGSGAPGVVLSSIEQTWEILKSLFVNPQRERSPIVMLVGLSGAGKTTYLTMTGEILRCKGDRFCFPYEGVDTKWVRLDEETANGRQLALLKSRVKDLVWSFAHDQHAGSIGRMHWPPPTIPEQGEDSDPATFFLVTEILRDQKSLGHVLTLETAGEEYQEVVRKFTNYMSGAPPRNPVHRVLLDMFNLAEGIVLLVDPDAPDNDVAYGNFFMVLKEELRPRALNLFYKEVRRLMPDLAGGSGPAPKPSDLRERMERMLQEDAARKREEERREEEKRLARERLQEIQRKLERGDEEVLRGPDGEWVQSFEKQMEHLDPARMRAARERLEQLLEKHAAHERPKLIVRYYLGLIPLCVNALDALLKNRAGADRAGSPAPTPSVLWELRSRYGLSDHFKVDLDPAAFQDRPVRKFRFLKHISVVVTKADRYPIVYPPENYPSRKLPGCWMHLRDLEDYLRICGGGVRYYNASATGYTLLQSGVHVPGRQTSHTPINVIEPLFDMLQIR